MSIKNSRIAKTSLALLTAAAIAASCLGCTCPSYANQPGEIGIRMPFQEEGVDQGRLFFNEYRPYLDFKRSSQLALTASQNYTGDREMYRGDFSSAIESYSDCVEKEPNLPEYRLDLGIAYLEMGMNDQAKSQFKLAKDLASKFYRNSGNPELKKRADEIDKIADSYTH
ncbi:MAG: tetratricopeptide repeat protein [Nanoarchaeota archaeon]|nr:tetratricopeptide repeat protein [Nanoarchaeota archaeon]